jgi:hypothetical protein
LRTLIILLIMFGIPIVIALVVLGVMLSRAGEGLRLKCTDCKHCKKRLVRPSGGSNGRGHYVSTYCHLLQRDLKPDSRCIVKDRDKAMYAEKTI